MFRVMTAGNRSLYSPDWLGDVGCTILHDTTSSGPQIWAPDLDDPVCFEKHRVLITTLGNRYDHDPRLSSVDIGSVGLWGEWHFLGTDPHIDIPSLDTEKAIVDLYQSVFPSGALLCRLCGRVSFDACPGHRSNLDGTNRLARAFSAARRPSRGGDHHVAIRCCGWHVRPIDWDRE